MMQLLVTTGLRRGECVGLKWKDVDAERGTIRIERSVVYTPDSGVIISTPKTPDSIRTIPVMSAFLNLMTLSIASVLFFFMFSCIMVAYKF